MIDMHNNSVVQQIEPTGDALTVKTNYIKRLEAFAKGAKLMVNSVIVSTDKQVTTINPSDTSEPADAPESEKADDWSSFDKTSLQAPSQRDKLGKIDEILEKYKNYLEEFELDIQSKKSIQKSIQFPKCYQSILY